MLLCSFAYAQILIPDAEKGKTTCGNGIREGHEMCEPKTDDDFCEQAGEILGIAMVCNSKDCSCLPVRTDCGNQIREGTEFCDPGEKETTEENDFCDELGSLFNETFTCDKNTCLCKPEKAYGIIKSVCGDGNVTGSEECEKDDDCRSDEFCKNCTCEIKERNITAIKEEVANETPEIKLPVVEEKKKEGFDYHDLVGVALPADLKKEFDEEKINVHVQTDEKTQIVIGVVTSHGVIQEIVDDGIKSPSFDAYVKKSKAEEILNATNKPDALLKAIEKGDVTYKPRGFFKRIVFWFKSLFS
ncbi:MAG: hypothetical protein QW666_03720 [Candidatus Woesearchaeota archaeon]